MSPRLAALATLCTLVAPAAAAAQAPTPQPFGFNDAGGFRDVLPPGTNGTSNAAQLGAFLTTGARPEHNNDQLRMYERLVFSSESVSRRDLGRFFKDATFGVRPGEVKREYSPRGDVTIQRDRAFSVPRVYGATRDGAMFGLGYVAAEDRLFLMDILRHVGRARLSSFVGGAKGNREFDREQWAVAPYTERDLELQIERFDDLLGQDGVQVQRDAANYVAGINRYIAEARIDQSKLPGEYAAINKPEGPDDWKATDIVATAALVGGIFGKGGGGEVFNAELLQAFRKRFGTRRGAKLYRDLRALEDPEAPTTVRGRRFPYAAVPDRPRGVALPDRGSVQEAPIVVPGSRTGSAAQDGARRSRTPVPGILGSPGDLPSGGSNALLVSARESASGRPLAVFGPQTGYFSPQLLMEQEVHAPGGPAGPPIDARGAAFAGTNLYVQLGRGRDYAWSATSAGQDIIDTFALELCEPDGSAPTRTSRHYAFRGQCTQMERLERTNSWEPSAADSTPAGSETLVRERTKLGLVVARATRKGRPIAYTELRSTYMHEIDSAPGFADFNNPEKIVDARSWQRAAHRIKYTFNWFYADDHDIAYFNSGANPVRKGDVNPHLPITGKPRFEWRGYDPDLNTALHTSFGRHPQAIDQSYLTSWNNKQAPGYRAAGFGTYTSVYRNLPLDDRIRRRIRRGRKISLPGLVQAMQQAGTVDLRGSHVLPWALKVIGRPRAGSPDDRAVAGALNKLRAWSLKGAHRRDLDDDGTYEDAEAIRIMDAWFPLMLRAQFEPVLGKRLFEAVRRRRSFNGDKPSDHVGSSWNGGWYGYAQKDLRTVLGRKVRGRYSREFCGRGSRSRCRRVLLDSLRRAITVPASELYDTDLCVERGLRGDQRCNDAIHHTPTGGITQPLIHWVNRPTYQQVVEVRRDRPGG